MFETVPCRIYYIYKAWATSFNDYLNDETIIMTKQLPVNEMSRKPKEPTLFILDDLVSSLEDKTVAEFLFKCFSIYSHNHGYSIIFTTQNAFYKIPFFRDISLNTRVFIFFRNLRDTLQVRNLAYQIFGNKQRSNDFLKVYYSETGRRYGYLILDLSPSKTYVTFHSNVFPVTRDSVENLYISASTGSLTTN